LNEALSPRKARMPELSKRDQMVLLMVISSIVLAFGVAVLVTGTGRPPVQHSDDVPAKVYVWGNVTLMGTGDTASNLNFTDFSGHVYPTTVGGENFGTYLPNIEVYDVTVGWVGSYPWQKGVVSASAIALNETSTIYHVDLVALAAPPSNAQLGGGVNVNGFTPTAIVFTGIAGNFTAPVSAGQFSIQLPNLTSYAVQITGQGGECSAGTYSFDYNPAITYATGSVYGFTCSK
jgi:hypothetical protein